MKARMNASEAQAEPTLDQWPRVAALGESVLVVVAHYDDESLFCGGTLLRAAAAGCRLHIAVVTDVQYTDGPRPHTEPRSEEWEARRRENRLAAFASVCGRLGARATHLGQQNASRGVDDLEAIAAGVLAGGEGPLRALLAEIRPDVVMTHGRSGEYGHAQHVLTNELVSRCWHGPTLTFADASAVAGPAHELFSVTVDWPQKLELLRYYRHHTTQSGEWDPMQRPSYSAWCSTVERFGLSRNSHG